jgi:hypothetical protein
MDIPDTGNIGHTIHRMKTNKTPQKLNTENYKEPHQKPRVNPGAGKG